MIVLGILIAVIAIGVVVAFFVARNPEQAADHGGPPEPWQGHTDPAGPGVESQAVPDHESE